MVPAGGHRAVVDALLRSPEPSIRWKTQAERVSKAFEASAEHVDWGEISPKRTNEWVTADALAVLQAAGRINI